MQPMVEPQPAPQQQTPQMGPMVDPSTAQLHAWEFNDGVLTGKVDGRDVTTGKVTNADLDPPAEGKTVQDERGAKYQLFEPKE